MQLFLFVKSNADALSLSLWSDHQRTWLTCPALTLRSTLSSRGSWGSSSCSRSSGRRWRPKRCSKGACNQRLNPQRLTLTRVQQRDPPNCLTWENIICSSMRMGRELWVIELWWWQSSTRKLLLPPPPLIRYESSTKGSSLNGFSVGNLRGGACSIPCYISHTCNKVGGKKKKTSIV